MGERTGLYMARERLLLPLPEAWQVRKRNYRPQDDVGLMGPGDAGFADIDVMRYQLDPDYPAIGFERARAEVIARGGCKSCQAIKGHFGWCPFAGVRD